MRITEQTIQDALYRYLGRNYTILPNTDIITGYEADMLAISRSLYATEFEIKLSLSDFRADLKKRAKHASLSGKVKKVPNPYSWGQEEKEIEVPEDIQEHGIRFWKYRCYCHLRPKQFWYVIHGFDVPINELPDYAGLMRYTGQKVYPIFETIKQAPILKAQKVDQTRITHAIGNMLYRYWDMRLREAP